MFTICMSFAYLSSFIRPPPHIYFPIIYLYEMLEQEMWNICIHYSIFSVKKSEKETLSRNVNTGLLGKKVNHESEKIKDGKLSSHLISSYLFLTLLWGCFRAHVFISPGYIKIVRKVHNHQPRKWVAWPIGGPGVFALSLQSAWDPSKSPEAQFPTSEVTIDLLSKIAHYSCTRAI